MTEENTELFTLTTDFQMESDPVLLKDTWEHILTTRQREVALALASGKTPSEIGPILGISVKTVDTHRGQVMKRLHVRNAVELCLLLLRAGVTQL